MAAPASLGVDGAYAFLQALPRNQTVHALLEEFTAGLAFLALIFQVGKGGLVHTNLVTGQHHAIQPNYATLQLTCSEYP